jgi:glucan 1,3-beta-glucosidase
LAALIAALLAIAGTWWWLAAPVALSRVLFSQAAKLPCVSYAPFRGEQNPLVPGTYISEAQIAQDLAQLATVTGCIRTYSTDHGLDQIPALARKVGLKVIQGIWIASDRTVSRRQTERAIALAGEFPDVITSIVVGNEVLLRGEMSATDLAAIIRSVKARVRVPVTYADVWEFWLRHREINDTVDFITIHILPYWEDFPVRADLAASHVDQIRRKVAATFPGKRILIGETGWPSAGRMRAGALPSRVNQARVISDILALARRDGFSVNLIEAYDQPWKRQLEGTVGGYWGLFDDGARAAKFPPGEALSNHPRWRWHMGAGLVFAAVVVAVAAFRARRQPWSPGWLAWAGVAATAATGGILLGVAVEKMFDESFGVSGWLRWGGLLAASLVTAVAGADALVAVRRLPTFLELIGPKESRTRSLADRVLGVSLVVVCVLAAGVALGFVFDARYQDFPYAALTIAVVPYAAITLLDRPRDGARPLAETVFAGLFALSGIYVAFNEGFANWQSLWMCGCFAALAIILWRARVAPVQE